MKTVTVEEGTSLALSSHYPAYYSEFQIRNWTNVDIIVTDFKGRQFLVKANSFINEDQAYVEIEHRQCDGTVARGLDDAGNARDLALPYTRTSVPFDLVRNSPYRDEEHGVIISTVDQAGIAVQMIEEQHASPLIYETRVDEDILDPRFVFQVLDPNNQWDIIYVNMFGRTVAIRAGHYADAIMPGESSSSDGQVVGRPRLICYLRYPFDYCGSVAPLSTVFDIYLDNIKEDEPIAISSGDDICVSSTMEGIQKALANKRAGIRGRAIADRLSEHMVSKSIYEASQKAHEDDIKRMQEEIKRTQDDSKTKLESLKVAKDNEVSKLKFDLNTAEHERDMYKMKYDQLTSMVDIHNKVVKDKTESSNKRVSMFMETLKIVGSIAVPIALAYFKIKSSKERT